jgi:hypothetical protein
MTIAAQTRAGGLIVYSTMGEPVRLADPPQGTAHWINPRTGERTSAHARRELAMVPPDGLVGIGHDWALLIVPH